eukprot:gene16001-17615_t
MKAGIWIIVLLIIPLALSKSVVQPSEEEGSGSGNGAPKPVEDKVDSGFNSLYLSLRYGWQNDDEDAKKIDWSGSGDSGS